MRWLVLTAVVILDVAILFWVAAPFLITYAEVPPPGISCAACDVPEVQRALARAAAVGRGQILEKVQSFFPVLLAVGAGNLAFLIMFGLTHARRKAA